MKMTFFTHGLINFFERVHQPTVEHHPCSFFIMHLCVSIPEFPPLFTHRTITHNIITTHMTQSMMNLSGAVSFLQKTNHATDITADHNGDCRVYVYLAATLVQLNKMDCWLAFSKITLY